MNHDAGIHNVSDTALWIAAYRAQETERADAAFKDPLAKKLAGERGFAMVASTPHTEAMAFAMVVRTAAIDRLVLSAIDKKIDAVINLGAGLDTRPYRLPLPANLLWIEVDFPNMIAYKESLLGDETPVCKLERITADLTNDAERTQLFKRLSHQGANILVITEGVIAYLSNDDARKLSADLFAVPSFRYWIMDYAQGRLRRRKQTKDLQKILTNAPLQFKCADPLGFFAGDGWKIAENRYILDEADAIGRRLPPMFPWTLLMKIFRKKLRDLANKTYGYVMFEK